MYLDEMSSVLTCTLAGAESKQSPPPNCTVPLAFSHQPCLGLASKPAIDHTAVKGLILAKLFTNTFDTMSLRILVTRNNPVSGMFQSTCGL